MPKKVTYLSQDKGLNRNKGKHYLKRFDLKRILVMTFFFSSVVFGHGGEDHSKENEVKNVDVNKEKSKKIEIIKVAYVKDVEQIFKKSCFDCHSTKTRFPWYYNFPIAKQLINYDVTEAKKHLDMSSGYPFKGHGKPIADLREIKKVISDEKMPLWYYLLLHGEAKLTEKDKAVIVKWVNSSIKELEDAN